jgi:hypothetical protein
VELERLSSRSNCSLFALGSHSKKRPHNLVLGRMYDFKLYDAVEFGVTSHKAIGTFPGALGIQQGNKVGDSSGEKRALRPPPTTGAVHILNSFFEGRLFWVTK